MKRCMAILAALLAAIMLLSACGENTPAITTDDPSTDAPGTIADATATEADITTEAPTEPEVTTTAPDDGKYTSLDGKTILFIGNSFVYYGGIVENMKQFENHDEGIMYQICKAHGENVTVIDRTFGGHTLSQFLEKGCTYENNGCPGGNKDLLSDLDLAKIDYVFISEAGQENSQLYNSVDKIIKRFPNKDTKFYYLCHSYTYFQNHKGLLASLPKLVENGIGVVEWGKLVYDVSKGLTKVEGATQTFTKNSFIVNKNDTYHPGPLSGYIMAQMCYSALTGRPATGEDYSYLKDIKAGNGAPGKPGLKNIYTEFEETYYNKNTTNFVKILESPADMLGVQKLIDEYLASGITEVTTAPAPSTSVHPIVTVENDPSKITLPEGYTKLEYLQANGDAYIDTGLIPQPDWAFDVDFQLTDLESKFSGNSCTFVCGSYKSNNAEYRFQLGQNIGSKYFSIGNGSLLSKSEKNDLERHQVRMDAAAGLIEMDGKTLISTPGQGLNNGESTATFTLFGSNFGSKVYGGYVKIYSFTLYKAGSAIIHFVPCVRASDGVAGLYDLIGQKFYTGIGEGKFYSNLDPLK